MTTTRRTVDPQAPAALPRLLAAGGPSLSDHARTYGDLPAADGLVEEVRAAGLTGRGGAAFPAAAKMASMGARGIVIANGSEGEPASAKDATLLTHAPHLVLDGLVLTARATGARDLAISVKAKHEAAIRSALAERHGEQRIEVHVVPDGYVSGEASSVARVAAGGSALPMDRAVRLTTAGPRRRPTLVQNVETLAHVALIARFGARWFRTIGTAGDPGSRLLTLSGDLPRPGVVEAAGGTSIAAAIAAGGARPDGVRAVLVGGYHGTWVHSAGLDRPLVGAADGSGVQAAAGALVVLGSGRCGLAATADITRYLAGQSAGQCGPCLNGLPAMAGALEELARGAQALDLPGRIRRFGTLVTGRGSCHHPDGTARMVATALDVFASDVEAHERGHCLEATR